MAQDDPKQPAKDEWAEDAETKIIQSSPGESPVGEQVAYLIVISGSRVGAMVKIRDGMVIGRGVKADFRTIDDGVSRTHVRIRQTPDGKVLAEDLDSRNGTYVNGERVGSVLLQDGDKIGLGGTTILKFSYADQLEEHFQQEMYNAALRDPLTQLYNRRHFDAQLRSEFSYAVRHGSPLSLIMLDLDHFKLINDEHGHPAGDGVLKTVAEILVSSTRREDLIARYGGEEFALLCRDTSAPIAFSIANRIRVQVEHAIMVDDMPSVKVTLSAGVAGLPDPSIGDPAGLVSSADQALYHAKTLGRNRVCIYDAEMKTGGQGSVPTQGPNEPTAT